MRLFVALQFDDSIIDALTDFQQDLRSMGVQGNYTKEENLHLTLAFIGEYGDPDAVLDVMEQVNFRPFELRLSGVGSFEDLFWVRTTGEEELTVLVKKLRHALADAGIPFDRKKFRPHITLIRKMRIQSGKSIPADKLRRGGMMVKSISLMKSERGRSGMIYTELGRISM